MGWGDLRNEARHNNSQPESPVLGKISSPVPWEKQNLKWGITAEIRPSFDSCITECSGDENCTEGSAEAQG